jgi:dipeptidyl aminopeptidase/acylaminoacyl peptidase
MSTHRLIAGRGLAAVLAGLVTLLSCAAAAAPAKVEDFFRNAQYGGAVLSPSGRYLAVLTPIAGHRGVAVIDLESKKAVKMESPGGADILSVVWQTDDRLVGHLGDLQQVAGEPPREAGIVAVNRDGTDPRVIAGTSAARETERGFHRPWTVRFVRTVPGGTNVLLLANERSERSVDLYRFDTATGEKHLLTPTAPGDATDWVVDFDGVPRAVMTHDLDSDTDAWYVRKSGSEPWVKVEEARTGHLTSQPMAFDPDGRILYVSARREGEDRQSVYEYDVAKAAFGKAVIRHPERDVDNSNATFVADYRARKLLGLRYTSNRPSAVWFDETWASVQAAVDKALPQTVNSIQRSREGQRWVVTAVSDRDPGEAFLLDASNMRIKRLFAYVPWIDPAQMAATQWVKYAARDGLTIPALLTLPRERGKERVPLVLSIHGGPNVPASEWTFNPITQFLASRGYAVLEPQFRGTEGFGWKLESAGFRKWGDEMQDDLEDGIRWAIAQGYVEPGKVCLFGGSYGGYAAMWGAIKEASSIKCAISLVGVSSIDYLFDNATTDMSLWAEKSALMKERIGDPQTERARFRRVNPVDNADKVGVPILLEYGASDRRVPLVHGTAFRAALDKYHKPYEWVVYDDEGHGLSREENRFDFFRRVDAFLAKYLEPSPASVAPASPAGTAPGAAVH